MAEFYEIDKYVDSLGKIILKSDGTKFDIKDTFNDYHCQFPINQLGKMLRVFSQWKDIPRNEESTYDFHMYGYTGNWIKIRRIPTMICLLSKCAKIKKRSKSELKRLATSTIINEFNLIRGLLGDDIKKKGVETHETSCNSLS